MRPRILVFGAGVLGSLYAARLAAVGSDVCLLARGERLAAIRAHGVLLEDALTGRRTATPVPTTEALAADDEYDVVVVLVRKTQLASALPTLAANASPAFLFMVSNAQGPDQPAATVGYGRVLLGFAGAGGTLEKGVVRYAVAPRLLQPTTLGELDGTTTPRLERIANEFRGAGFPVALESRMDAWQKTHEAWVSPVANAIYAVGGDTGRLRTTRDVVVLMLRAIRENFALLRALEVPITPPKLRAFDRLPEPLLVPLLQARARLPPRRDPRCPARERRPRRDGGDRGRAERARSRGGHADPRSRRARPLRRRLRTASPRMRRRSPPAPTSRCSASARSCPSSPSPSSAEPRPSSPAWVTGTVALFDPDPDALVGWCAR